MNIPKQIRMRTFVVLLACMLVVSSVSVYYAFSASTPTSGLTDIYVNPPMQESSYVIGIYTAPSTCYLQNGTTGQITATGSFYSVLQTAITALTSGGKIFIRGGDYYLSTGVNIAANNIYIEGETDGSTSIEYNATTPTSSAFTFGDGTWHYLNGLRNMWLHGDLVSGAYGVIINGAYSDVTFSNVVFTNFDIAVAIIAGGSGSAKVWNVWLDKCLIEDNMQYGIYLGQTSDPVLRNIDRIKISECHFYDNKNSIFCDTQYVYHVTFTDNTVQGERQACINDTSGGRQWIITDNHIFDCGIGANGTMAAIMVNGTGTFYADSWLIEDNIIANHFTSAPVALNNSVWLTGTVSNFSIQNNFFYVSAEPIRLSGLASVASIKISGNLGGSVYPYFPTESNGAYSYVISSDGTYYYMLNCSTNFVDYRSTNASAIIDSCIVTNTTIFFKIGIYNINYLLPVDVSNIHFIGSGWGTQFNIGAGAGFNISSATALYDITFENLYFYGSTTTSFAITSSMPSNTRNSNFLLRNCRFDGFTGSSAQTVYLMNLEESHIENNFFYKTTASHITFAAFNYESGNNHITGNVFYTGYNNTYENSVRLVTLDNDTSKCQLAFYQFSGNHYLGVTNLATLYHINITSIEGYISKIMFSNERSEFGNFYTDSINSSYTCKAIEIGGGSAFYSSTTGQKFISFGAYTTNSVISNDHFQNDGSGGVNFEDNCTSSTQYNTFANNVVQSGSLTAGRVTYVHGNSGMDYTVKVEGTNNIRSTSATVICNWGANNANLANSTIYTVRSNDVYVTISGGTLLGTAIYDPAGTLITDYGATAITMLRIPHLYQINITWAVEPAMSFAWVS